jgi:4-hydroxybenzoate polyprenyltransferase
VSRGATAAGGLAVTLEMIKFQHTVFALPFAWTGMILAAGGWPSWWTVLWVVVAMVGARSAAMAFNRIADRNLDARNPRTAGRPLVSGRLSTSFVAVFTLVSAAVFVLAAGMLNPLCLMLSPVALVVILGYSYTKRFTALSHFVLGLGLGIAPMGGWLAVRGAFDLPPFLLSMAVLAWTAGFDILYACQDIDFDRRAGLHSVPDRMGLPGALWTAAGLHSLTVVLLAALAPVAGLGWIYLAGVAVTATFLLYEHSRVKPNDLSRLNAAFFRVNALISVVIFVFTLADLLLRAPAGA